MSVPKLRFKEFDGDWTLASLNQLSSKIGDGIHATPKYDENGTIPFINGNNLVNGQIIINGNTKRINTEEFQKYNQILSDQTLFLSINGTIGNLAFYKNEQILLGKSVCFINLKNDIDKKFIYLLLQSPQLTKTFNSELTGTTIKNLSLATVRNSEFYYPREKEQTKIASFLSAVDEKISQLTQKHQLLSQYKQGMMQKLFSQQIRFKADDGSEFGEWEEKKLGEISTTFSGGTPKSTNKKLYQGKIPFIKSGELSQKHTEQFINELALKESSAKLVKKGDLLYALYGATSGHVAISQIDGAINQAVLCIRSDLNTIYLLNFFLWKKDSILSTYLQGGQGNLSAAILKEILVPIPCLKEQTKIANFLSTIDQKIEVTAQQIEQAKQWKKGLLQQMFV